MTVKPAHMEIPKFSTMKIVVRFSEKQEAKALPILLRHSPGMVLPKRTYILAEVAVKKLLKEGIKFQEICREMAAYGGDGVQVQ